MACRAFAAGTPSRHDAREGGHRMTVGVGVVAAAPPRTPVRGKVLRAAWLSLVLGVGMEVLSLGAAAAFGIVPTPNVILADLVQKITWSVFVCVGLSLGAIAAEARPLRTGVAGFLVAPAAFVLARAAYQSVSQALALQPASGGPSPVTLAILKALEYAFLGAALGGVARRWGGGLASHAGTGLAAGVLFGGVALALAVPLAPPAFVNRALNEVLFPVGCALIVFATGIFDTPRSRAGST